MVMVYVVKVRVVMVNVCIPLLSGPPSCLCSKTEQCEITGDNEIDVVPNITEVKHLDLLSGDLVTYCNVQEEDCQELCATNPQCGYYTWSGRAGKGSEKN